jgi:hypothetical protein
MYHVFVEVLGFGASMQDFYNNMIIIAVEPQISSNF